MFTPDQFGGWFTVVLFLASIVYMFWKPLDFFKFAGAMLLLSAFPYGFWCLYGWNGLIAYNAMMNTFIMLFALAHSK